MKLKFIFFLLTIFTFNQFSSQIAITEVYYDTPFNEKLKFGNQTNGYVDAIKHHRGEFVEIYNYSDKDINLKGWYLKDLQSIFWLPEKIIKSQQFMVIAYSTLPSNTTIFQEHFTTTAGKQEQIIYQDKILLRNKRDVAILGYKIGDSPVLINKSSVGWEFRESPPINFVHDAWANPQAFYNVNSIQYNPNHPPNQNNPDLFNNYMATPNPLEAIHKPPLQNFNDLVKEDYLQNYSYLDWTDNVNALVNRICQISIQKVEQIPNGTYNSGGKCFSYDIAGNYISSSDCNGSNNGPQTNEYTYDELEAIKNSIVVYPNPATSNNNYVVNISWSGPSINKISNLQVYTSGGGLVYGFTPTNGVNSTSFSLQGQLPGVFVANFILNTGQVISKNILKW
ncbi:lamin tail domain-containing protein [Epilithonimonas hominis]|uniref:lamin tail domain-containing protein n=1 Tax=Epilithonimonas hominis TaxID=420404 RepID=UPI00289F344D|nr:lamin tail domain-containing protein [Epilithonimonas hominis]